MGGVDENDLGRPSGSRREMREVDRVGGTGHEGRDGKRRHQELGVLIDEPAERDDGDRQVGAEGERAPHCVASVKRILVQKSCDLFPGPQRERAVSRVDALAIGEEEPDRGGGVVGIGYGDPGPESTVGFGNDPAFQPGGGGRDAGFRDENPVLPQAEYGQSGGQGHSRIGLHLSISDDEFGGDILGGEGNPAAASRSAVRKRAPSSCWPQKIYSGK